MAGAASEDRTSPPASPWQLAALVLVAAAAATAILSLDSGNRPAERAAIPPAPSPARAPQAPDRPTTTGREAPAAPTIGGALRGRVLFPDSLEPLRPIPVLVQNDICGVAPKPNEALLVSNGGLANCVVTFPRIEKGLPAQEDLSPRDRPLLDQQGCEFRPHVLAVQKGEPFMIRNSDPVIHSAHAISVKGRYSRFNLGFPAGSPDQEVRETNLGPLAIRCDAGHRWMSAFIYVAPNPFHAVTDAEGNFRIDGVPPGEYRVKLWHEVVGNRTYPVHIVAGEITRLEVVAGLSPRPGFRDPVSSPPR